MSNVYSLLPFLLLGVFSLQSCDTTSDEVVETSYIYPPVPDPTYSFKRNGTSSVDILECQLVKQPLDYVYSSFLVEANLMYPANMTRMKGYFNEGEFGWSPRNILCRSALHAADSAKVLSDVEQIFTTTGKLSGLGTTSPSTTRNQRAEKGKGGFVGYHIGDVNLCFADDRGVVVAEMFQELVRGAAFLDQILNVHLDEAVLLNEQLRNDHENGKLLPGRNYTALEHHWDLAWGYYQYWLPLVENSEISALKKSRITLYRAFALGRQALTEYRYTDALEQMRIVRSELSKVAAANALHLLTGTRTLSNLQEEPAHALPFLGQALGAIYALQFTRNVEGKPYFTYDEVKALIATLTAEGGMWERERLLGTTAQEGVLFQVAKQIKERSGLK